jgi:hypothetical protein
MTLEQFLVELYYMPPQFVPVKTQERLSYWIAGRHVGVIQSMLMWKENLSKEPFLNDASGALGLCLKDELLIINAQNFEIQLEWFYDLDQMRVRIDMELMMWKGKPRWKE